MKNLSQRPTEASSRPVRLDRGKVGLKVSSIDAVTLSDGEGRENARGASVMARCPFARMILGRCSELVILRLLHCQHPSWRPRLRSVWAP